MLLHAGRQADEGEPITQDSGLSTQDFVMPSLIAQVLIVGLMMGALYALMAIVITFIASVMKMINWSMGEFYMIGAYVQFALITQVFGSLGQAQGPWYVAVPLAMLTVFAIGVVLQRLLLAPMFQHGETHRFEYATIMTIAVSVLFQNVAIIWAWPHQSS